MTAFTLSLVESDYQRLEKAAKRAGKSVQALMSLTDIFGSTPTLRIVFQIMQL